jgi:site-specific DNA-methyltransferase (adenine-specific)
MKNRNIKAGDDWATPPEYFAALDKQFNFDFDPCPLDPDFDGLEVDWGERNFVNPPYSRKLKEAFVKKAIAEAKKGKLCVCLLPVSTSTQLFHKHILPNAQDIIFIEGRLCFQGVTTKGDYVKDKVGMFDSMLVIFDGHRNASPRSTKAISTLNQCKPWYTK